MNTAEPTVSSRPPPRLLLFALALGVGAVAEAIVAIASGSAGYVLSNLSEEYEPLLVDILIDAAPFLFLAARGVTARKPWIVGLVLFALVWAYVAIKFVTRGFDGGTSVGNSLWLAAVSIGSSLTITIVCWLVSRREDVT